MSFNFDFIVYLILLFLENCVFLSFELLSLTKIFNLSYLFSQVFGVNVSLGN
jgi:hypothetical protein